MFTHPVPRPRVRLAYTASGECITKRNLTQRLQSHHRSHPDFGYLTIVYTSYSIQVSD